MTKVGSLTAAAVRCAVQLGMAVTALVTLVGSEAIGSDSSSSPAHLASDSRPLDQVWLVSTRHLGCPCGDAPRLEFQHGSQVAGGNGVAWCHWRPSSLEEFLAADTPGVRTVIYVHGNRMDDGDAFDRGQRFYRQLTSGLPPHVPLRFVVWSWPSAPIHGPLKDVRTKAARTDSDAFYLGWLLARLQPDAEVSLLGYSFGARIVTGALHVRAGGTSAGAALDRQQIIPRRQALVALTAGAMDHTFIYPGSRHGQALSQVERMLVMYNSQDRVLKRYRLIEQRNQAQALGYMGLEPSRLGDLAQRIRRVDASCAVGTRHAEIAYTSSVWVGDQLRAALFREDELGHAAVVESAELPAMLIESAGE